LYQVLEGRWRDWSEGIAVGERESVKKATAAAAAKRKMLK